MNQSRLSSAPLESARPVVHPRGFAWDRIPVVLIGWALFAVWWLAGARFTIDGLPLVANTILSFFHVGMRLPRIADPYFYLYLAWLPIGISYIERRNRPRGGLAWRGSIVTVIGVWLAVCALDLGSTWLAVTEPEAGAWLIARQVAALWPLAALWTAATTFVPEIGLVLLWRYLRG